MTRGNGECAAERRGRGSSGSVHRGNAGAARRGLCTGPCHPPARTASARPQHLHGSTRQLLESLSFTGSLREISGTKNSKNDKKCTIKSISFLNYVVFFLCTQSRKWSQGSVGAGVGSCVKGEAGWKTQQRIRKARCSWSGPQIPFSIFKEQVSGLYRLYNIWPLCCLATFWNNLGFSKEGAVQSVHECFKIQSS